METITKTARKINILSGEILSQEIEIVSKEKEREPSFIKIYTRDIATIIDLENNCKDILLMLLDYANYDNTIIINAAVKRDIALASGYKVDTITVALNKLTKSTVIKRLDTGKYQLNPKFFGKGNWRDIKELRIRYNSDGREIQIVKPKEHNE